MDGYIGYVIIIIIIVFLAWCLSLTPSLTEKRLCEALDTVSSETKGKVVTDIKDVWDQPIILEHRTEDGREVYTARSAGPDMKPYTDDDETEEKVIVNWDTADKGE